ncbi:MAG: entericidin A/B family lipoprotein [Methylophilus sp.]
MSKAPLILELGITVISGCNTMHGLGQDIEDAGEAFKINRVNN